MLSAIGFGLYFAESFEFKGGRGEGQTSHYLGRASVASDDGAVLHYDLSMLPSSNISELTFL
jgi:hypothetical protein